jgi:hypothetical protein
MAKSGMAYDSVPFTLVRTATGWSTAEGEAARKQERDAAGWARVRAQLDQGKARKMSGFARNNLCGNIDGRGFALDESATEPAESFRAPDWDPAASVKAWIEKKLGPGGRKEFEQFINALTGGEEAEDEEEGQEVAHPVRTTGPIGVVPGTRMRDRGDPVGEDDDLGVLTARGPTDARGRRVPVSGLPKGALDRRRAQAMANDQVRREAQQASHARAAAATREYEQRWPGRFVSKCDV